MMAVRKIIMETVILLICPMIALSQQSNTLFFMHELPQANLLNPAVQIRCKYFIGLPVLASTHFNLSNTGFSINQALRKDARTDSFYVRPDNIVRLAHRVDLLSSELQANLISLGYKYKSYYFTFNVADKAAAGFTYPRQLTSLVWNGNSQYEGQTVHFNSLRGNAVYYREYAAGLSLQVNEDTYWGLRVKLLFGKADIHTSRSISSFTTAPVNWDLRLRSNIKLNGSLPVSIDTNQYGRVSEIEQNDIDISHFLLNSANKGFAFDLGFIYNRDSKTSISGSLLDVGFIHWSSDLHSLAQNSDFFYSGTGFGSKFTMPDYLIAIRDSINHAFGIIPGANKYYSFLAPKSYLGVTYKINNKTKLGILNRNVYYREKIHAALTFSANTNVSDFLTTSLSYTLINSSFNNIGLGIGLQSRNFLFHFISDNMLAPFYKSSRNFDVRFGFSFLFGCPKAKKLKSSPGCAGINEKKTIPPKKKITLFNLF
ncbi:MAG: DUF5723 family protein, partial [Bacteroidota bacterium]|nr:DUF5723 family protein [Bacteroidota bacterium]